MKTVCGSILLLASMALASDHVVLVGSNGLTFTPDELTAATGDTISFQFIKGNHSVAQSTFGSPCEPNGGVWSGFEPVAVAPASSSAAASPTSGTGGYSSGYKMVKRADSEVPQFQITVNSTAPLWFYCAQANHCQMGMVFAVNVNATSNKTLAAYQSAAAKVTTNVAPTFAAQGGVQSEVNPSSAPSSSGTSVPSSAAMNLHHFSSSAVSALLVSAVFGAVGFMAIF